MRQLGIKAMLAKSWCYKNWSLSGQPKRILGVSIEDASMLTLCLLCQVVAIENPEHEKRNAIKETTYGLLLNHDISNVYYDTLLNLLVKIISLLFQKKS